MRFNTCGERPSVPAPRRTVYTGDGSRHRVVRTGRIHGLVGRKSKRRPGVGSPSCNGATCSTESTSFLRQRALVPARQLASCVLAGVLSGGVGRSPVAMCRNKLIGEWQLVGMQPEPSRDPFTPASQSESSTGQRTLLALLWSVRVTPSRKAHPRTAGPSLRDELDPPGADRLSDPRDDLIKHGVKRGGGLETQQALGFVGGWFPPLDVILEGRVRNVLEGSITSTDLLRDQLRQSQHSRGLRRRKVEVLVESRGCSIARSTPWARSAP